MADSPINEEDLRRIKITVSCYGDNCNRKTLRGQITPLLLRLRVSDTQGIERKLRKFRAHSYMKKSELIELLQELRRRAPKKREEPPPRINITTDIIYDL